MHKEELNELILKRKEEIIHNKQQYSYNFYLEITSAWNALTNFLDENNFCYDETSMQKFLESNNNKKNAIYNKYCIEALNGLDNITYVAKPKSSDNISLFQQDILKRYHFDLSSYNSPKTVHDKTKTIIKFMQYLDNININDYHDLQENQIRDYIKSFYNSSYSVKKRYLGNLRSFLCFLCDNNYCDKNYSYLIKKIKYEPSKYIPEPWTIEEIEMIEKNLLSKTGTEKRNKAIVLIAIHLGIRAIDIKNLQFKNIDWQQKKIKFVQQKTKVEIELPLPNIVGNAIIDYIKNGRPTTDSKYIFVTHDFNVSKLSNSFNIHRYLEKVYKLSKVNYKNKEKRGIHLFRHSLASNMLNNETPLEIISSVLGHVNTNSTCHYLKIDSNKLSNLCLEVPDEL